MKSKTVAKIRMVNNIIKIMCGIGIVYLSIFKEIPLELITILLYSIAIDLFLEKELSD